MPPVLHLASHFLTLVNMLQISEAYRRFGITPTSKDIIIVKILISSSQGGEGEEPKAATVAAHLTENVRGEPAAFTDEVIAQSTDWPKIRKYYKLNGVNSLDSIKDEALRKREMEMLILGSMALRGV